MKEIISFFIITLLAMAGTTSLRSQTTPSPPSKIYDVAAYIWPAYCPDDRAKIFWPDGIGEWQTVMQNISKFTGQDQPRVPLWGYVNESDPDVMRMEINAAADHGVNVFVYDWYWFDRMPFLEGGLDDGFLKAKNNGRMQFYIMWANHDVNLAWDKRNADDAFTGKNKALIWKGAIDRLEYEKIVHRWIEKYFSRKNYYKIDGKPVLMIYDLRNFVEGFGGVEQAQDAIAWFRAEVKKAGFPGLELQLALRKDSPRSISGVAGDNIGTQRDLVQKLGFDLLTHYQWCHFEDMNGDYTDKMTNAESEWATVATNYAAYYCPNVTVGWDSSPRTIHRVGAVVTNNTPANFEKALRAAKALVDAHPKQPRLITINSWNEWAESSYLEPDTEQGYGYLDAVKNVFGTEAK